MWTLRRYIFIVFRVNLRKLVAFSLALCQLQLSFSFDASIKVLENVTYQVYISSRHA